MANVFISYSSEDRERIVPIVQTIRSMASGQVFQDYLSILPGERWRERVLDALQLASRVFVFWCQHAEASAHVREEYEASLRWAKAIVPVLLDDTSLPEPLRAFQWLDFRRPEAHGGLDDSVPIPYRRNEDRHFYPFGPDRDAARDWDHKSWADEEYDRHRRWKLALAKRQRSIAQAMVAVLEGNPSK